MRRARGPGEARPRVVRKCLAAFWRFTSCLRRLGTVGTFLRSPAQKERTSDAARGRWRKAGVAEATRSLPFLRVVGPMQLWMVTVE